MPIMDGTETFHKLKEINPRVKVMLFSGFSADDKAAQLVAEGALGFIQKPFLLNKLADEVATAIAK